jgi:hypothetical protein
VTDLRWSWLAAPYLACSAVILAVALAASLIRGDRVLRLGVIGAAATALPWSACQALAACTDDAAVAARLLRLGQGPVAGVGPNLLLLLLGVSGQLERFRWIARLAGAVGVTFTIVCWTTDWIVPGAQLTPSGMFYIEPGPLTGLHVSQLIIWLAIGLVIARRATPGAERKRMLRLVLGVLVAGAIGSLDTLLLYRVWGVYPIAWLPASVAAGIALYLVVKTDLVRPQGFDRSVALELAAFAGSAIAIAAAAIAIGTASALPLVMLGALVWAVLTAVAWTLSRARPVRVKGERELEGFVARAGQLDTEAKIAERLGGLWKRAIGIEIRTLWWRDQDGLISAAGARWPIPHQAAAWLVQHGDALALTDLATMRLGAIRAQVEALGSEHGASLLVPLVDREELVGLVEADYDKALRDTERGLIAESSRAAARALTFIGLARAAARERETAREVEVADALRLQASASRDTELGRWVVAAEYRTAARSTGAGWSAIELADGRLALLATEAQDHGVAAALATAAITGAFAAATHGSSRITLDDVISTMRASSDGVLRMGEPVAAFLAILDAQSQSIEWACAGHPGAFVIGPIAHVESGLPQGSGTGGRPKAVALAGEQRPPEASLTAATRGQSAMHPDSMLVVASTGLRGDDTERWQARLTEVAPASGRIATVLVETALRAGAPSEDLLAVVVRSR